MILPCKLPVELPCCLLATPATQIALGGIS